MPSSWIPRGFRVTWMICLGHFYGARSQLRPGETIEGACSNAVRYGNPVCVNNGTLHVGDRSDMKDLSCSYCDCEEGWGGLDCGRCVDVSVCPDKDVNGTMVAASNCSSDSLIPTDEESATPLGKMFSCSCGGGGDSLTAALCPLQPDTWAQVTVRGPGTDDDPATFTFTLYAGVEVTYREDWPGEHEYFYPVIYAGAASDCRITRGACPEVDDVDFEGECVRFDCQNTQGDCPPEGYPVCDGFPDCRNEDDQRYQVHLCLGTPQDDTEIIFACEEEQQGTSLVDVDEFVVENTRFTINVQAWLLVAGALCLILLFALFALATDWGTAKRDSRSCCYSKRPKETQSTGREWNGLAAGDNNDGVLRVQPDPHAAFASPGTGVGAARAAPEGSRALEQGGDYRTPALLRWKNVSYSVPLKRKRWTVSGIMRCNRPETLSVLTGVSGFAGPKHASGNEPGPDGATSGMLGGHRRAGSEVGNGVLSTDKKPLLRNDSPLPEVSGTVTGILGPSGAGKSSLLDLLAGRKRTGEGRAYGHVSLVLEEGDDDNGDGDADDSPEAESASRGSNAGENGALHPKSMKALRHVSGYVPQEDVLPGTLTCYEHLMFHARLRMPRRATHAERRIRALSVLDELGLNRVADSRIGDEHQRGLSGGERRRLSIAAELMARPSLLFLDEPTTGLDASTALRLMTLIRDVANRGTTVMCSLHQPRPQVLDLLDKVLLLSQGQVCYFGPPSAASSYFASVGRPFPRDQPHAADAMLELCSRSDSFALPSLFRSSPLAEDNLLLGTACRWSAGSIAGTNLPALAPTGMMVGGARPGVGGMEGKSSRRLLDQSRTSSPVRDGSGAIGSGQFPRFFGARRPVVADGASEESEAESGNLGSGGRSMVCGVCETEGSANGAERPAGFLVQTEAVSKRLLIRAVRHPLLLMLHFLGSVMMAVCLGTIFEGRLEFTLNGAQSRLGVLFFILIYLALLSLTSLPVWREDRRLFLTENMAGAYGHLSYFTSVALADVLLVRVIPPLVFSIVAYPVMGLNSYSEGHLALLWFALILVLTNVAVALGAMGVGALGLPLDLSNFTGGIMVLLFALFGRFLLNNESVPEAWEWLTAVTPLGYAYESLLINEFYDPLSRRPFTIDGSECSPDLPTIKALGSLILTTFNFDPELSTMYGNVSALGIIVAVFAALSFIVFFLCTRTTPLSFSPPELSGESRNSVSLRLSRSLAAGALAAFSRANSGSYAGGAAPAPSERENGSTAVTALAVNGAPGENQAQGQARGEGTGTVAAAAAGLDVNGANAATASAASEAKRDVEEADPGNGGNENGRSDGRRVLSGSRKKMEKVVVGQDGGKGVGCLAGRVVKEEGLRNDESRLVLGKCVDPEVLQEREAIFLSWEGIRLSIPAGRSRRCCGFPSGRRFGASESYNRQTDEAEDADLADGLTILDSVSGFAGPSSDARAIEDAFASGEEHAKESRNVVKMPEVAAGAHPSASKSRPEDGADMRFVGARGDVAGSRKQPVKGSMTAILGPSGAGKTSLLNVLAGHRGASGSRGKLSGEIRLNGEGADAEAVRGVSGYVTQEDVLPETLTCYEHLMFHACLRMRVPSEAEAGDGKRPSAREARRRRVLEVLRDLNLSEVADSRIGSGLSRGVSGGEKRRLSIGTELLTHPGLLFLDEPTTGLDSSTALTVMRLLSAVASKGTTILCSLHQPRPQVLDVLDNVLVMSRGRVAFFGPVSTLPGYFAYVGHPLPTEAPSDGVENPEAGSVAGVSPADALLDMIGEAEIVEDKASAAGTDGVRKQAQEDERRGAVSMIMPSEILLQQVRWAEERTPRSRKVTGRASGGGRCSWTGTGSRRPPFTTQIRALGWRALLNAARDPYLGLLHVAVSPLAGLLVGGIFGDLRRLNEETAGVQGRLGLMFFVLLLFAFLCLTSLASWVKQATLFRHERASGAYGATAYLFTSYLADALVCRIAPPVVFACIVNDLAGLRPGGLAGLCLILVVFNAGLAGVLSPCGTGARSGQEALAMGCLVVVFSALLSGYLVATGDLSGLWGLLVWVSPIAHGFEALAVNEFSAYGYLFKLSTEIGDIVEYSPLLSGDDILGCFGFDEEHFALDIFLLLAIGAVGLVLAFGMLRLRA